MLSVRKESLKHSREVRNENRRHSGQDFWQRLGSESLSGWVELELKDLQEEVSDLRHRLHRRGKWDGYYHQVQV